MTPLISIVLIVGVAILLVLLIDRAGMNADASRLLSLGVIIVALVLVLLKVLPS